MILDTDGKGLLATNAAGRTRHLLSRLDEHPDDDTLSHLAAAVLGCEVLDIVITHTERP